MSSSTRKPGIHIAWKTVTYRSVALAVCAIVFLLLMGMHFLFPEFTDKGFKAAGSLLEWVAGAAGTPGKASAMSAQQAHITALDGTVRVKKANSNTWVPADYNVPLEKGDVVQTGPEGMAKIVFNDGTNYTVKQDSLIAIEENSANEKQQTNVAVAVSTGTVDLSTGTYIQGSKSQVIVAGATASLAPESAAMVRNDPKADKHEFLMKKGQGEVTRNGEVVQPGRLGEGQLPSRLASDGEVEGNWFAHAHLSRKHDAHLYVRKRQASGVFLDADEERCGIPPAHLAQSLLHLHRR